jgi:hypothetical protein
VRRTSIFLLILTFFGLTPEYRIGLFSQIHEIVYFGNGGYDWGTVYNMPIWLRLFTFRKIEDFMKKQNEASEPPPPKKNRTVGPAIKPGYSTKASK